MKSYLYALPTFALALSGSWALGQENIKSRGNAFNPDTSVNLLGLYQHSKLNPAANGFSLQEAEIQFAADIDPYWRASALFSIAPEADGSYGIDPEEVYAETIALPYLTLKGGKFKVALGKQNTLHTHAFSFIDAPLIHQTLLGDEGWNDTGVSAAALIPHLPWFSELTVQAVSGNSATLFNSANKDDVAGNAHLKNLIELNDSLTAEVGVSDGYGKNSANGYTNILGADLTFKYRPVDGGKYHSILWSTEYLKANRTNFAGADVATSFADLKAVDGLGSWVLYQFAERWRSGVRYDVVGLSDRGNFDRMHRASLITGFSFSEFSELRAQYDYVKQGAQPKDHKIALQLNISMGAHPAHAY